MCECGKIMLDAVRTADMVETKEGHANFVTVYDKKVQETLRKKLLEILPEAVFVGEEDDVHVSIEKRILHLLWIRLTERQILSKTIM